MERLVKQLVRNQSGQSVLIIVLILIVLGGLIMGPLLGFMGTGLKAGQTHEEMTLGLYAADAGIEDALWQMQYDEDFELPEEDPLEWQLPKAIDDRTVDVSVSNEGEGRYKIASVATSDDGSTTTIESYVEMMFTGGFPVFEYALVSLDGDIDLGGNSEVGSDEGLDGNIHANGNIVLSGNADIYGDASATGTISTSGNAEVHGDETPSADPLAGPEVDGLVDAGRADAENITCAVCGGYSYTGQNYQPPKGTHEDAVNAKNKMTVSGNGDWIFEDTVCAGVETDSNLVIQGNANVVFEGRVRVGGDLQIQGNGMVRFEGTVCVGGELKSEGNKQVTFDAAVHVEGDVKLTGNKDVPFGGTLYVGGDLKISGNKAVGLGGTVYVCGDIIMSGNSDEFVGNQTVIAEGNIQLTGNSDFNEDAEEIPFVISLDGDVTLTGNSDVAAVVYALNGDITLTGNSSLYGSAVGLSVTGGGNNDVLYPMDLRDREDLPGHGESEGSTLTIVSWQVS
jgi:hypothetical protein